MKYSNREKKDLAFAGFMISLAFSILLAGGIKADFNSQILEIFLIAFFTAGIGFLLHELMHKFYAQKYNCWAEFRADYKMNVFAVVVSFFGFIIAAPGAVYIRGNISTEKNGKISLAGPVTNIVLALIFLPLAILYSQGLVATLAGFGLTINSLLAAFNMIPTMPFDGAKVIKWNKRVYYTTLIIAVGLFVLSWLV
ncbi:MAG: hypothetical protein ABEI74_03370 [Candidatus Pacearchaeota archaeon]